MDLFLQEPLIKLKHLSKDPFPTGFKAQVLSARLDAAAAALPQGLQRREGQLRI